MTPEPKPYSVEWSLRYFDECERIGGALMVPSHKAGIALAKALRTARVALGEIVEMRGRRFSSEPTDVIGDVRGIARKALEVESS